MRRDRDGAWDERLLELLASYDEALAAGDTPSATADKSFPAELRDRFERVTDCLDRLERRRLRIGDTAEQVAGEVVARGGWRVEGKEGPSPPSPLPGGERGEREPVRVGPFQVVRVLGAGGFGIVYLAEDPRLGRQVALKVPRPEALLHPELRHRFLREARAAARLHHTNILPVFEVGEAGPLCYIVSAYCSGGTLAEWLASRKTPVPPRLAAHLIALLCDGVQHAHEHGILHRDLKPSNVLLRPEHSASATEGLDYTPLLADFGLAKFLEAAADMSPPPILNDISYAGLERTIATTRGAAGTPQYMAPEQAGENHDAVAPATDVYALGSILYQLLTGRPPFAGEAADVFRQVMEDEPVAPRRLRAGLSRDLETICLKCLRKAPSERYPSARELGDDLRRWLAGEPVRSRPASKLRRLGKWVRRRPAAAGLILLSLVTALSLLGGTLWYAIANAREELHQRRLTYAKHIVQAQQTLEGSDYYGLTELMNGLRLSAASSGTTSGASTWKPASSFAAVIPWVWVTSLTRVMAALWPLWASMVRPASGTLPRRGCAPLCAARAERPGPLPVRRMA
jgi:serine/threonine protein kinase